MLLDQRGGGAHHLVRRNGQALDPALHLHNVGVELVGHGRHALGRVVGEQGVFEAMKPGAVSHLKWRQPLIYQVFDGTALRTEHRERAQSSSIEPEQEPRPGGDRTDGNRRAFSASDLRRLSFIRHARGLGFGIEAIRTLPALQDKPEQSCEAADAIARTKLGDIEQRIARLTALKDELMQMLGCDGRDGAPGNAG
ncbi:hypothetical protein GGD83_004740 [Rhodoblastus sphagnicola]|uniref:MerR family DNA-binding protein n=1 Tax=Rhodoblastus sphagnicola TaxID=333368 RepID=UPI0017BBED29|nr:hypothetical protein [Rhodoblastus sphagnicola]